MSNDVVRACAHIPRLRTQFEEQPSLDPRVYGRSTCFAAGHLVTKNAGWRNMRPVLNNEVCTLCGQCELYCPDGAIYEDVASCDTNEQSTREQTGTEELVDSSSSWRLYIDYDFCKGCGICVRMCRFGALAMVPEGEVAE